MKRRLQIHLCRPDCRRALAGGITVGQRIGGNPAAHSRPFALDAMHPKGSRDASAR